MPLTRAQPLDPRKRLIAFAADLLSEIEDLDLDIIDGEFYWRWCRADLLEPQDLMPKLPRAMGVPAPTRGARLAKPEPSLSGVFEPESLFDYLREGLRFVEDLFRFSHRLERRFPRVVWQRLLYGERVSMRAAELEIVNQDRDGHWRSTVRLRVFSGAWSGKQVEDEIRLSAADDWDEADWTEEEADVPANPQGDLSLHLRFAFVDARQAEATTFGDHIPRGAHILVEVPLPLPPKDTIAREYDALVRQENRWHAQLVGSGSRQEKVVAVRTWVIGLLVHAGVAVNSAIDLVHLMLSLEPISQSRFGEDRRNLLERVPEAEPYLYALIKRDDRDTRGERAPSLVSDDPGTVSAQPFEANDPLFP